jgi:hypothetical protein
MNSLIFKITKYIINNNIKNISLIDIISKNIDHINECINNYNYYFDNYRDINIYSFQFKFQLFKKLVLYDYCFNYIIDDFSDLSLKIKKEIKLLNDYILNVNNNLNIENIDEYFLQFLNWCKKYNRLNKKKIYFSNSEKYIVFR